MSVNPEKQDQQSLSKFPFFHTRGRPTSIDENPTPDSLFSNHHKIRLPRKYPSIILTESTSNSVACIFHGRLVRIRLIFIRIGEIDTLNEKYQADVYFEARWIDNINLDILNMTKQQRTQLLNDSITIRLEEYSPVNHWTPQLFIENAIALSGESEKWFTLTKIPVKLDETIADSLVKLEICEHRRCRGAFWEKLELNHFPVDVQDLTVSITSNHHSDIIRLVQDDDRFSIINREAFFDQQEWTLYEHVATEMRETKEEYSFEQDTGIEPKMHPVLAITCRAAREPGYYYWNGFCLIFLITLSAFCIFSIPPNLPQNRLQITSTLLLTSVTFRWVVNRSLPTISYLTTLDKYAIISIFILVILCIWHAVIAAVTFIESSTLSTSLTPDNKFVVIDRYLFIILFAGYILFHVGLLIWLMRVPYKRRRDMRAQDREYTKNWENKLKELGKTNQNPPNRNQLPLSYRRQSTKSIGSLSNKSPPGQFMNSKENIFILPNGASFAAINEEPQKLTAPENSVDLHY